MSAPEAELRFPGFPDGAPAVTGRYPVVESVAALEAADVRDAVARAESWARAGSWVVGYLAYEAAPAFDRFAVPAARPERPVAWFGRLAESARSVEVDGDPSPRGEGRLGRLRLDPPAAAHRDAVARIRRAIERGEVYQVNHTARLRGTYEGAPSGLFEDLLARQGACHGVLLRFDDHAVVSASPELFFARRGDRIWMRPMKGTAPRGRFAEEDRALADALRCSAKERAENTMIVDVVRNDLGRVAEPGTVEVTRHCELERYPTVWQLTSTVEARARPDLGLGELLAAVFPCASVTGAPKIAATEWIARLEHGPRGIYCGALGLLAPGGDALFSVPIRTAWLERSATGADRWTVEYGVGGGVVWDSTGAGEHREALIKARVLTAPAEPFELLETMRCDADGVRHLDLHLERLGESAAYFGFPFAPDRARRLAELAARSVGAGLEAGGREALRLRLSSEGALALERRAVDRAGADGPGGVAATKTPAPEFVVAAEPVRSDDPFLCHKTTRRGVYERARGAAPDGVFDVLLHNEAGELTEFTAGNVVLEREGRLLTPRREAGLLAGIGREVALREGVLEETVLEVDDLRAADRVYFVNAVRGWIPLRRRRLNSG